MIHTVLFIMISMMFINIILAIAKRDSADRSNSNEIDNKLVVVLMMR